MTFSPKAIFQRADRYEGVRPDQYLPLAPALYPDVLRARQRNVDSHPHPPGTMGPNRRRSLVRLDCLRHPGRPGNHSPFENATDRTPRNFLQNPLAHPCRLPALVQGHADRLPSRRHHIRISLGHTADRSRPLGLRVCHLHLQSEEVESVP